MTVETAFEISIKGTSAIENIPADDQGVYAILDRLQERFGDKVGSQKAEVLLQLDSGKVCCLRDVEAAHREPRLHIVKALGVTVDFN